MLTQNPIIKMLPFIVARNSITIARFEYENDARLFYQQCGSSNGLDEISLMRQYYNHKNALLVEFIDSRF